MKRACGGCIHDRRQTCNIDERSAWFARDPIERFGRFLIERGVLDEKGIDETHRCIRAQFEAAVQAARREPLPTLVDLETDVLAR